MFLFPGNEIIMLLHGLILFLTVALISRNISWTNMCTQGVHSETLVDQWSFIINITKTVSYFATISC